MDARHSDVADVVQQRRDAQGVLPLPVQARLASERDRQRGESARRARSVRIVSFADAHE